ncbi:Protein transport protein bos1 [Podospora pseudopauciseta]|uniref:Protein transport protein BOS1 n=1 Tax=Podospora pseudopauciseta TaxID=2093780 RepID=A0ABR0HE98_9PEZI|nr:Protein transport protein bos1 [Podospora pseudopauciseta]
MNTTFNSALKQSTSLRKDLSSLSSPDADITPAILGSVSASLAALSRTIDEYNTLAKQELNKAKQEKAFERIKDFKQEISSYRALLDRLNKDREEREYVNNRGELLGRRPFAAQTPENPYTGATVSGVQTTSGYGHARTNSTVESGGGMGIGSGDVMRESHALREQAFFQHTNSALDDYIARGQAVLGDLGQQREILKNTQRKLYSVGNTLGISGDTIRMVERRAKQDKWIFWGGVMGFFMFCWLVLHYLR